MTPHLLPLSALHAAAPGVLDVVFRPDGDFKGAPPWAGPMTSLADTARHSWLVWRGALHVSVATADGHWSSTVEQWREQWALDLRIPTVAARLAGLCARALGIAGDTPPTLCWSLDPTGRGRWMLTRVGDRKHGPNVAAWDGYGLPIRCYADTDAPLPPPVVVPPTAMPAEVLAALTLALAPRIAALKK